MLFRRFLTTQLIIGFCILAPGASLMPERAEAQAAATAAGAKPAKVKPKAAKPAQPENGATDATRIPPPGPAELPLFGARDFEDSNSNIGFTVPAGWVVIEVPQKQNDTSMILLEGPGAPAPTCRIGIRVPKQPPKITQALINKAIYDERNLANVRSNLAQNGGRVLNISKITQEGVNGLRSQILIPGTTQRPDVTLLILFFDTVGHSYTFQCSILSADYETMHNDVDAIVKSARFLKS